MIKTLKRWWKSLKEAANAPMTDHQHEWNMAQCGVPPCPCCGKRHRKR